MSNSISNRKNNTRNIAQNGNVNFGQSINNQIKTLNSINSKNGNAAS